MKAHLLSSPILFVSFYCLVNGIAAACPSKITLSLAIDACAEIENMEVLTYQQMLKQGLDEEDVDPGKVLELCEACEAALAADLQQFGLDLYDDAHLEECTAVLEQGFAEAEMEMDWLQSCYSKATDLEHEVEELRDYNQRNTDDIRVQQEFEKWKRQARPTPKAKPQERSWLMKILFPTMHELMCSALFGFAIFVIVAVPLHMNANANDSTKKAK